MQLVRLLQRAKSYSSTCKEVIQDHASNPHKWRIVLFFPWLVARVIVAAIATLLHLPSQTISCTTLEYHLCITSQFMCTHYNYDWK